PTIPNVMISHTPTVRLNIKLRNSAKKVTLVIPRTSSPRWAREANDKTKRFAAKINNTVPRPV
ncbi:unnamed protein product, partial [marine sediment metagenome]